MLSPFMQIITKKKAKTKTFHAVTFDIRDTGSVSQSSLIFWFLSTVYYKLLMRLKLQEFANFEYQRYRKCESVFRHLLISLHSVLQTPDEIETSRICQFWIEAAKSQKWYQKLWQTVRRIKSLTVDYLEHSRCIVILSYPLNWTEIFRIN